MLISKYRYQISIINALNSKRLMKHKYINRMNNTNHKTNFVLQHPSINNLPHLLPKNS